MKEHIRSRLMKTVENYDRDKNSRSLMDFIQTNVRLCTVISNLQGGSEQPRRKPHFFLRNSYYFNELFHDCTQGATYRL